MVLSYGAIMRSAEKACGLKDCRLPLTAPGLTPRRLMAIGSPRKTESEPSHMATAPAHDGPAFFPANLKFEI
jgi:hypothetical protein